MSHALEVHVAGAVACVLLDEHECGGATLELAQAISRILLAETSAAVLMTRQDDQSVGLRARAELPRARERRLQPVQVGCSSHLGVRRQRTSGRPMSTIVSAIGPPRNPISR